MKINKREFNAEMIISTGTGRLTPRATEILLLLAKSAINKFYYYIPQDREDCIQTAYQNIFSNWHSFNHEKSENAFAYFTEIFKRGAAQGLGVLYKKRGDPENKVKMVYMNSSNEGEGIFNF